MYLNLIIKGTREEAEASGVMHNLPFTYLRTNGEWVVGYANPSYLTQARNWFWDFHYVAQSGNLLFYSINEGEPK